MELHYWELVFNHYDLCLANVELNGWEAAPSKSASVSKMGRKFCLRRSKPLYWRSIQWYERQHHSIRRWLGTSEPARFTFPQVPRSLNNRGFGMKHPFQSKQIWFLRWKINRLIIDYHDSFEYLRLVVNMTGKLSEFFSHQFLALSSNSASLYLQSFPFKTLCFSRCEPWSDCPDQS